MTPEEFEAVEAKVMAELQNEIVALRTQLQETEGKLELSLSANGKLTEALTSEVARADAQAEQQRIGTASDYLIVLGAMVGGCAVGYVGQKYLGKVPIMAFPAAGLVAIGISPIPWDKTYKIACGAGGLCMGAAAVFVWARAALPPYATR